MRYVPGLASVEQLADAIRKAGYDASERVEASAEEEKARRAQAYRADLRLLWISAALSLPLVLQMFATFDSAGHEWLPRWLQLALATPVQFWIGRRFYVGG